MRGPYIVYRQPAVYGHLDLASLAVKLPAPGMTRVGIREQNAFVFWVAELRWIQRPAAALQIGRRGDRHDTCIDRAGWLTAASFPAQAGPECGLTALVPARGGRRTAIMPPSGDPVA